MIKLTSIKLPPFLESRFYLLLLYILLIFIFGLIYNCFAGEFYHSTVQFEQTYKDEQKEVLLELKNLIEQNYKLKYDTLQFTFMDSNNLAYDLNIKDIEVTNLNFALPEINFTINFNIGRNDGERHSYTTFPCQISMNCVSMSTQFHKITNEPYVHIIDNHSSNFNNQNIYYTLRTQHIKYFDTLPKILKKFYPWREINTGEEILYNRLVINDDVSDRFKFLSSAQNGFPYKLQGSFVRFLYFSSTTQTGLGPGDILPLSNRVRFFVILQTILGLVLMGLFLNAIALNVSEKRNQSDL